MAEKRRREPASDVLTVNVGGTLFTSRLKTLRPEGSMLATILDQDSPFADQVDNDGHTFIDRSPEDFKIILDFLRRGQILYDAANFTRAQLDSLRAEADYYMLPGLVTQIDDALATTSLEGKPPTRYWQGLKVAEGHYATDKHNIWWIVADEDEYVRRTHLHYAPVDTKLIVGVGGFAHADKEELLWHNGELVTVPEYGIKKKTKKVNWQSFTVNGVSPWGRLDKSSSSFMASSSLASSSSSSSS